MAGWWWFAVAVRRVGARSRPPSTSATTTCSAFRGSGAAAVRGADAADDRRLIPVGSGTHRAKVLGVLIRRRVLAGVGQIPVEPFPLCVRLRAFPLSSSGPALIIGLLGLGIELVNSLAPLPTIGSGRRRLHRHVGRVLLHPQAEVWVLGTLAACLRRKRPTRPGGFELGGVVGIGLALGLDLLGGRERDRLARRERPVDEVAVAVSL